MHPAVIVSLFLSRGLTYPDCPTIPISSGLSRFCLKIPNPDQYPVGIGKIAILTFALSNKNPRKIFSSNSNSIDIFRRPNQNNGFSCKQTDEIGDDL